MVVSTISRVIVSGLWCRGFYEGKVYVNDVMGGVYRWSGNDGAEGQDILKMYDEVIRYEKSRCETVGLPV